MRILAFSILTILVSVTQLLGQDCTGPLTVTMQGSTTGTSLSVTASSTHIYCREAHEGSISISATGGNENYEYQWAHDENSTDILTDLKAGNYYLTVTDEKGCSKDTSVLVRELHPLFDSLDLIDYATCATCNMWDTLQSYFIFDDDYIASIIDEGDNDDLGNTTVCVDIAEAVTYFGEDPKMQRCWSIESDDNESATYRLFFSREEFDALAQAAGYEKGEQLINANSIYALAYYYEDGVLNEIGQYLPFGSFTVTLYDRLNDVWSVEFTGMPNAKIEILAKSERQEVELLLFDGEKRLDYNHLWWETATEIDFAHFIVERSREGIYFDSIGYHKGGEFKYTFDDHDPLEGDNYYRLRMYEPNGALRYSHIIRIQPCYEYEFNIINTLVSDKILVDITSYDHFAGELSIIDIVGRKVTSQVLNVRRGKQVFEIDAADLIDGNYVVIFENKRSEEIMAEKIVKIY